MSSSINLPLHCRVFNFYFKIKILTLYAGIASLLFVCLIMSTLKRWLSSKTDKLMVTGGLYMHTCSHVCQHVQSKTVIILGYTRMVHVESTICAKLIMSPVSLTFLVVSQKRRRKAVRCLTRCAGRCLWGPGRLSRWTETPYWQLSWHPEWRVCRWETGPALWWAAPPPVPGKKQDTSDQARLICHMYKTNAVYQYANTCHTVILTHTQDWNWIFFKWGQILKI